jgi:NifU-like protein involved in Fe-S cluster formation
VLRLRLGHRLQLPGHRVAQGRTIDEGLEIRNTEIVEELSLPPVKIHCSVLAEDAIKAAIADYQKKNGVGSEAGAKA